jgi:hypothetical protein
MDSKTNTEEFALISNSYDKDDSINWLATGWTIFPATLAGIFFFYAVSTTGLFSVCKAAGARR